MGEFPQPITLWPVSWSENVLSYIPSLQNECIVCSCIAHITCKTWSISLFGAIKMLNGQLHILCISFINVCVRGRGYHLNTWILKYYILGLNKVWRKEKKTDCSMIIYYYYSTTPMPGWAKRTPKALDSPVNAFLINFLKPASFAYHLCSHQ